MAKLHKYLFKNEAIFLELKPKTNEKNRNQARYYVTKEQYEDVLRQRAIPNKRKFIETQKKLNKDGNIISTVEKFQSKPIDVPDNFEVIKISTSKTTGQQWIQYAPKKEDNAEVVKSFDFKSIIESI